jgi:integrase
MLHKPPKHCQGFVDRHGHARWYYRRPGFPRTPLPGLPWSPEFMAAYESAMGGATPVGINRTKPGTMSALIATYYKAPEFTGLAESTQTTYRNQLERFRAEHGDKPVSLLQRGHIKAIIGGMASTPAAANNLLDRLKMLMGFAVEEGIRPDNPTFKLKGFRVKSDGFHTWTEDEIAAFEAAHPIGSKPRLAMALMLYTGQRRSDAVRMGRQYVSGNRVRVRQQKTSEFLEIPMHPELVRIIAETPKDNMTFLVTAFGKPFTPAGFGNWFREQCDAAKLPQCSAHGLRKAAARRLAEAGCTNAQIKAITGHKTDAEVTRYTKAAEQVRLAEAAMKTLKSKRGTKVSTPAG